jgi:hypothetical protein
MHPENLRRLKVFNKKSVTKDIFGVLALFAAMLVLPVYAGEMTDKAQAPERELYFAGTVEINSTQLAFIISGQTGSGTLEFAGGEHEFSISGLGIGGIGVQTLNAVGAVYNMDDLSQFNGTYVQGRAGITVGKGKGVQELTNAKTGVVMELKSSSKGAALAIGADGMVVKLK